MDKENEHNLVEENRVSTEDLKQHIYRLSNLLEDYRRMTQRSVEMVEESQDLLDVLMLSRGRR